METVGLKCDPENDEHTHIAKNSDKEMKRLWKWFGIFYLIGAWYAVHEIPIINIDVPIASNKNSRKSSFRTRKDCSWIYDYYFGVSNYSYIWIFAKEIYIDKYLYNTKCEIDIWFSLYLNLLILYPTYICFTFVLKQRKINLSYFLSWLFTGMF